MKEKDIRERIHTFLKNTVQHVVVPASMGIGLALVGCSDGSLNLSPDGSADTSPIHTGSGGSGGTGTSTNSGNTSTATGTSTASGPVALYMAIMPDAAVATDGKASSTRSATSTATETVTAVAAYMAMMPDAGMTGTKTATASQTFGYMYMAIMPDAGKVDARGPRNDAKPVMPDAGLAVADYMAMMPVEPPSNDAGRGIVALYAAPVPTNK